jgi:hypothetical protein
MSSRACCESLGVLIAPPKSTNLPVPLSNARAAPLLALGLEAAAGLDGVGGGGAVVGTASVGVAVERGVILARRLGVGVDLALSEDGPSHGLTSNAAVAAEAPATARTTISAINARRLLIPNLRLRSNRLRLVKRVGSGHSYGSGRYGGAANHDAGAENADPVDSATHTPLLFTATRSTFPSPFTSPAMVAMLP